MSVKKQTPSLFKLYSFYKELPEFLDVSDVDSHFEHIFDVSQSQHRRARVGKGSNKKSFTFKLFQFCDLKTQQRYFYIQVVPILRFKDTAALYPPKGRE